jgi:hypothetical protein
MANAWLSHVKKTMKAMKSKGTYTKGDGLKKVIMEAKKTYKKHRGGDDADDAAKKDMTKSSGPAPAPSAPPLPLPRPRRRPPPPPPPPSAPPSDDAGEDPTPPGGRRRGRKTRRGGKSRRHSRK